ncbi:MAG: hypothetical protein D6689_20400 [Deltaproteobacteria bacterium]|nr:MAG: hypothetical protein D6689_20400 [Deltaproteobacteria bacterium]
MPSIRARRVLVRYAPLAVCAVFLVWHSLQYAFITDDAYISFVYARNLAEHGQPVFNLGLDPVEGYTNFLWVVLLAALMRAGVAPEIGAPVCAAAFAIGTLALTFRWMERVRDDRDDRMWSYVPAALLAASAGYACWTSGGLETQMFTFFTVWALVVYARGDDRPGAFRQLGVVLALAALTRPEGLLVAAVLAGHRAAVAVARRRLRPSRDELWCVGAFFAIWVPYFAWRWWYYGYPLPNTAYVKAGDAPPDYLAKLRAAGWHYVWVWARQTGMVYAAPVALAGAVAARLGSRGLVAGTAVLAVACAYLAYTVRVGGDFMGLHRFIMPVFACSALLVARGAAWSSRLDRRVGWAVAAALVAGFAVQQQALTRESMRWGNWASDRGIDTPAFLKVYTADRARIGRHMRPCMREDDFSIFGGAGAKPYYGRMRGVDVFGLVSEEIAHQIPPTRPRPGHNKWAPDSFLYDTYQPTFAFHCYSIHTRPDNPRFNCNPAFWLRRGYERVTLHIPGLRQQGEYYSFFKRADREFTCPGRVP